MPLKGFYFYSDSSVYAILFQLSVFLPICACSQYFGPVKGRTGNCEAKQRKFTNSAGAEQYIQNPNVSLTAARFRKRYFQKANLGVEVAANVSV
jgi:hypothetical protein